jgi:nicotinamide-nucleotide amidase
MPSSQNQPLIVSAHDQAARAVAELARLLKARGWRMATAESCTGGMIAAACTDLAGSSDWFERGWVTYSNAAKIESLGVPADLIERYGAVSEPVARAMALDAQQRAGTQAAVAVTGVAGPSGGSPDKPVGTVWFGGCAGANIWTALRCFDGDRTAVRAQTVAYALARLRDEGQAAG